MTKAEREKAIDLLDNLRGMIEDNQGNDYDFALKKGIEALKHEQGSDEMTVAEYRHRMIQTFLDTNCDELIALCVLPTEKEFEHLEWLLEKHFKQEPCEDWHDVPSYEMTLEQARQAVKDLRKMLVEYRQSVLNLFNKSTYYSWEMCWLKSKIEELPLKTPTRKKGKWIKTGQSFINPNKFLCYSCSECGDGSGKVKTKFCPNCGAEMESEG